MQTRKMARGQALVLVAAISTVSGFNTRIYGSNDVWSPTAATGNWGTSTNWSSLPVSGDSLEFGATSGPLTLSDNLMSPSNYSISAITFDAGAPAYVISPASATTNGFSLAGPITDNSTSVQTINDPIALTAADAFTVASSGGLVLGGSLTGTGSITTAGAGALTLAGSNSFTGGVTIGAGSQLNINSATALGTSASVLTINGGTIDNTSAAAKTLSTNNQVAFNGDFVFKGTQNLSLGNGVITLGGGSGSTRTVNVSAGTLNWGYIPTANGIALTKTGAGTLYFNGNGATSNTAVTNLGGPLNVLGGAVSIGNNDMKTTGLTGSGIVQDGSASTRWYFINSTSSETFSGTLQDGSGAGNLGFNFTGTSAASLTLSGNNTLSDLFTVAGGTVNVTGTYSPRAGNSANSVNVWTNANYNAAVTNANPVLNISGGTFNAADNAAPSIQVGAGSTSTGVLDVGPGSTVTTGSELWLATGDGGYGLLNETGGSVTVNSWLALGRGGGTGVASIMGGTLTVNNAPVTVGSFGGSTTLLHGVVVVGGTGTVTANNNFYVGEQAMAVVTVMGSGTLSSPTNGITIGVTAAGANSTLNLDGGTVLTPSIAQGNGSGGSINFNGGLLKATASNANFLTGVSSAYIYSGGATIDDGGNSITIAQNLLAPTGAGVSATGMTVSGSGFTGAPAVQITGGGGTGATAIATIDSGGNLSGIAITDPGVGYTSTPTITLIGGGLGNTGAVGGTPTLVTNVGGGFTKQGAGVTALTGSNTYTGATVINAGTLALGGSGAINSTSSITVNNGSKFLDLSSTAVTPGITVTSGTLDGIGSLSTVVIGNSSSNVLSSGNGSIGQLTIGSLTFNGAATTKFITDAASEASPGILTNTLATGASTGVIKVNVTDTDASWSNGTYDLLAYNSSTGAGYGAFKLGTVNGLTGRQSAALTNVTAGAVDYLALTVTGVAGGIVWTGTTNGNWTTSASAQNWTLNGSPTSFVTGDNVTFDDTASGTTSVSITDSTVAPSSVTFNNSNKSYTISGPGSITGNTGITLNGTGNVTISSNNTYTGGTVVNNGNLTLSGNNNFGSGAITVNSGSATLAGSNAFTGGTTLNAGTLNINSAGALGSGTLTINAGTLDNTGTGAVAVSTNNSQAWNGNFTFNGTQSLNLGTGNVSMNSNVVITTAASTLTVGGAITGAGVSLSKEGVGALALTGSVSYTGNTYSDAGTLTLNSLTTPGNMYVASTGTTAVVNMNGTVSHGNFLFGNSSGGVAAIYQTGGTINQTGGASLNGFNLGNTAGAYGYLSVGSGATVNSGDENVASVNGGDGMLEVNGGTINNNGWLTMTRSYATTPQQYGTVNIDSGTYNYAGGGVVANWGGQQQAVINVQGGKLISTNNTNINLNWSGATSNEGILNLNGGVVEPSNISGTAATVNFNGGTLRASSSNTNFIAVGSAYVYSGGAVIDTNGNNITIAQPLLAPSGGGVTTPTVTSGGSGYVAPPLITVTPGSGDTTGTGATAIATINRTTGQLTGITITNPGVGYTAPPVFNLTDGGGATSPASITASAPVANVGGGLTKVGAGTLTLSAPSTYTGPTVISAGTLQIGAFASTSLVASYSFDNPTATPVGVPTTIVNSGSGGSAMNGVVFQSATNSTNAVQIVSGGPNINGNGGAGNSLSFDGSGGTVNISNGIINTSSASSWTFSTWVQTSQSGATIFSKDTDGTWGNGNSIYYFTNGTNGGGTYPGAVRYAGGFVTGSTPTTDGNWHMVTYVDSYGTKSIYVDGVLSPLSQAGFTTADVGDVVQLGFSPDTVAADGTQPMTGNLDDLDFFSGALTPAQIQSLYTTNNAGISATAANALPATTPVILQNSGAVLDLNGNALIIGSLNGVSGSIVALGGGTLTVGNATSTTFAGTISDSGGASSSVGGSLVKQGTGTLTLSSANNYSGGTTVNAGLLVAGGGTASLGTGPVVVNAGGLIFRSTSAGTIYSLLRSGYNGGAWNGTSGISSVTASNDPNHIHALGMLQPTSATTFEGQSLGTGDVAVKYTYYGDTNLDGKVDGTDYSRIDNGYLTHLTGWQNGDFNYDGVINGSDYTLIDNAYNTQGADIAAELAAPTAQVASGASSVPEPASLGILAVAAVGLLGRRCSRRRFE